MPKKRRTRRSGSPLAPILLLAFAALAGWWLLRPHPNQPSRPTTNKHHNRPVGSPTAPAQTASPMPVSTPSLPPSPSPSPSPITSPSTMPSPAAAPQANHTTGARLAIIIDDCGQWLSTERGFIALPVPITLSVLPDVHGTATIASEAAAAGKGVMLHLPMSTLSGLYPGPGEIRTRMTDAQIRAQVRADLAQVPLAQGVNNHEGSKATADARVMQAVASVIASKHLFFVDSRTNSKSVAGQTTQTLGIPTASRDVFLDNKANEAYTIEQLRDAGRIALAHGSAIAIGHPRPTTLAAIKAMLPEFARAGIHLVLVADLTENP